MAEGVGFEPTVGLLLLLISSQVPLTTQPPFLPLFQAFIGYVFLTITRFGQADSSSFGIAAWQANQFKCEI
ncbi:MAG: hypothetical protein JWO95_145 [Verrucomicrobiales bacterium]|nr:hypothetical protein [Verrucomicrobiales bacterium]